MSIAYICWNGNTALNTLPFKTKVAQYKAGFGNLQLLHPYLVAPLSFPIWNHIMYLWRVEILMLMYTSIFNHFHTFLHLLVHVLKKIVHKRQITRALLGAQSIALNNLQLHVRSFQTWRKIDIFANSMLEVSQQYKVREF